MSENKKLLANARALRKKMTPHERKLWYLFLRTYPVKIYKQRVIGNYIVDFYCAAARLVIELDGSQHCQGEGAVKDGDRDFTLAQCGLQVLRFSNREINEEFARVCEAIHEGIQRRICQPAVDAPL